MELLSFQELTTHTKGIELTGSDDGIDYGFGFNSVDTINVRLNGEVPVAFSAGGNTLFVQPSFSTTTSFANCLYKTHRRS